MIGPQRQLLNDSNKNAMEIHPTTGRHRLPRTVMGEKHELVLMPSQWWQQIRMRWTRPIKK